MEIIQSYKDLEVWKRAVRLVTEAYVLTGAFPKEELYGITSQIRRAALSIPANIAEGRTRGSKPEFIRFLRIAFASGAELETLLLVARSVVPSDALHYTETEECLAEVMKMLNVMIARLVKS